MRLGWMPWYRGLLITREDECFGQRTWVASYKDRSGSDYLHIRDTLRELLWELFWERCDSSFYVYVPWDVYPPGDGQ